MELRRVERPAPAGPLVVAEHEHRPIGAIGLRIDADTGIGWLDGPTLDPGAPESAAHVLIQCGERMLHSLGASEARVRSSAVTAAVRPVFAERGWAARNGDNDNDNDILVFARLGDEVSVLANRRQWDRVAPQWVEAGRRAYAPEQRRTPTWGCWQRPEAEVQMLADVAGRQVVELGCGTGYVSAWCLEAGAASVVGVDNSAGQLASARQLQDEFDVRFPLIHADAAAVPLADGCVDFAISEYGAAIWADPYRWIPEAARLLRPGGILAFLGNSLLVSLCAPDFESDGSAGDRLLRPQRDLHRIAWPDTDGIEYHIGHGEMIRLLRQCGFEVLDLKELFIEPDDGNPFGFADGEWGSQWPVEEVWFASKR
ncbi:MAG: methyltransferase domain-containing protein [Actinomycetota bacterium]